MDDDTYRLMKRMALRTRNRPDFIGHYLTAEFCRRMACSEETLCRLAITPVPGNQGQVKQVAKYFAVSPELLLEILGR